MKKEKKSIFRNGYGIVSLVSGLFLVIVGLTMYLTAMTTQADWLDSLWFYGLLTVFCCIMPLIFFFSFTAALMGASRDKNKVYAVIGVIFNLIYLVLAFLALAEEANLF